MSRLIPVIFVLVFHSLSIFASGWTKSTGKYYGKVEQSDTTVKVLDNDEVPELEQKEDALNLYGEYGVTDSVQLTLFTAVKRIKRVDQVSRASLTGQGAGDTDLFAKAALPKYSGPSLSIYNAATLGLTLATTSQKFRDGDLSRFKSVANDEHHLVAPVDRGKTALILGLGSSLSWKAFWMNIGFREKYATDRSFTLRDFNVAIGSGLPSNSWLQLSWDYSRTSNIGTASQTSANSITGMTLSGGYTFWRGVAFEPRYTHLPATNDGWSSSRSIGLGLSVRSL